jgi:hypothetical protein
MLQGSMLTPVPFLKGRLQNLQHISVCDAHDTMILDSTVSVGAATIVPIHDALRRSLRDGIHRLDIGQTVRRINEIVFPDVFVICIRRVVPITKPSFAQANFGDYFVTVHGDTGCQCRLQDVIGRFVSAEQIRRENQETVVSGTFVLILLLLLLLLVVLHHISTRLCSLLVSQGAQSGRSARLGRVGGNPALDVGEGLTVSEAKVGIL